MSTSRQPERELERNPDIERAYAELNQRNHAAASTVEALMYSLRRGVDELTKPDTQRRLSELSEDQLRDRVRAAAEFQTRNCTSLDA